MPETFGPSVYRDRETGEYRAQCIGGGCWCFLLVGQTCTDDRKAPPRQIPDVKVTPDWCQYRASMIEDAREMDDFHDMGLATMTRPEMLAEVRGWPKDQRPKPLSTAKAHDLRKAIRAHEIAKRGAANDQEMF